MKYFLNLYSLEYSNWLDEANYIYTSVNDIIADVQDQYIISHERLSENVYKTTYEEGKQIIVNYGSEDYTDEALNVTVGSYDFLVIEEGN